MKIRETESAAKARAERFRAEANSVSARGRRLADPEPLEGEVLGVGRGDSTFAPWGERCVRTDCGIILGLEDWRTIG